MEYFTITDKGKIRINNEDAYSNIVNNKYSLFILCDGMGGHNSGEVASNMAVEAIQKYIEDNFNLENVYKIISDSVHVANDLIYDKAISSPKCSGMGTTLVLTLAIDDRLFFANAGDSRIYLFRDGCLKQLTTDHSYVQNLVNEGLITKEQAHFHPLRNQITSALGTEMSFTLDIDDIKMKKNDLILLTSDGLTDMVDDDDIKDVLNNDYDIKEMTEILTYIANSSGGRDNITITLAKYNGD